MYKIGDYLICKSTLLLIKGVIRKDAYAVGRWSKGFIYEGMYIYTEKKINQYCVLCNSTNILKAMKLLEINNNIVNSIEKRSEGRKFRKYGITILHDGDYVLQEKTSTFLVIRTSLKGVETSACTYAYITGLKVKDYKFLKESTLSLAKELSKLWKDIFNQVLDVGE